MAICSSDLFAQSWKFIAVGDSRGLSNSDNNGVNTTILGEIAAQVVSQNAEFVIFPGDLVYGNIDQTTLETELLTWRNTMQPVYDASIPVYAVRGNHDLGSPVGVTAWNNVFSGSYAMPGNGPAGEENLTYSVSHNNALILGLDLYTFPHRVDQTWVDAELASNSQPHVFAFTHEPAFATHHADCLDDYPTNRNLFWESLASAGGRAYFAGHDHFYDHARIDDGDGNPDNDLHQYVVGTGGAPLRDWSPPYIGSNAPYTPVQEHHAKEYGYVVVEIDGADATLTWFERTAPGVYSATADVFSYSTSEPEPVEPGTIINHAAKIYYVGNNAADANLVAHLENDLGHDVVQVSPTSGSYAGALAAGADLIVLSGSMGSSSASGKGYHTSAIPVLNFEPFSYDNFGWTGDAQAVDFGDSATGKDTINIDDASHPITGGFSAGPLAVLVDAAADSRFGFGVPGGDADVLASYQGGGTGNGKPTVFVYEKGDNLVDPTDDDTGVTTASSRYIGFFLDYGVGVPDLYAKMNDDGRQLFDQAVEYAVAAPDPVAHWTFDEDFSDSAGDNHGTAVGGAAISSTQYMSGGGALRLDESNAQYVTVDGLAGELATGDDVTITMWINTTRKGTEQGGDMLDASDNIVFSAHTDTGGNILRMGSGVEGGFYLNPTDIGGTAPNEEFGADLNDGQWQFVAVTLAGDGTSTVQYYNNGNIVEIVGFTDRAGYPDWTAADLFSIGQEWDSSSATNFFDGWIDDMRIYDTALTQYQIEKIYLSAIPELVADPAPGDANRDGVVNAADATILAANWQSTSASWAQGDFNGDGNVDDADATLLAANWQSGAGSNASVPEPGMAFLLISALIAVLLSRLKPRG